MDQRHDQHETSGSSCMRNAPAAPAFSASPRNSPRNSPKKADMPLPLQAAAAAAAAKLSTYTTSPLPPREPQPLLLRPLTPPRTNERSLSDHLGHVAKVVPQPPDTTEEKQEEQNDFRNNVATSACTPLRRHSMPRPLGRPSIFPFITRTEVSRGVPPRTLSTWRWPLFTSEASQDSSNSHRLSTMALTNEHLDRYTAENRSLSEQTLTNVSAMRMKLLRRKIMLALGGICLLALEVVVAQGEHDEATAHKSAIVAIDVILVIVFLGYLMTIRKASTGDEGGRRSGDFMRYIASSCLILGVWILATMLSFSASSGWRRAFVSASPAEKGVATELCDEGTTVLWIAVLHAGVAVFGLLPFWLYVLLTQMISLQHLVLGFLFPQPECSTGYGWQPLCKATFQLSLLSALLSMAAWRCEATRSLENFALCLQQFKRNNSTKQPNAEDHFAVKTLLEEMVTDLRKFEVQSRRSLVNVWGGAPVMEASIKWMLAVHNMLAVISKIGAQLQIRAVAFQSRGALNCRLSTFSAPEADELSRTGIVEFLEQSFLQQSQMSECGSDAATRDATQESPYESGETNTSKLMSAPEVVPAPELDLTESAAGLRLPYDKAVGRLFDWEFNALEADARHGKILQRVGYELLNAYPCISQEVLPMFLRRLDESYPENPYHCAIHAADVCNSIVFLLSSIRLWHSSNFSDMKRTAVIIAALAHDVGHFGYNNHFLISTRHFLANVYNDKSILENFHCANLFALLASPTAVVDTQSCIRFSSKFSDVIRYSADVRCPSDGTKASNGTKGSSSSTRSSSENTANASTLLLENMPEELQVKQRQLIIALILATDTQSHLEALADFRMKVSALNQTSNCEGGPSFDPDHGGKDQQDMLCTMFRAADIGHSAKAWDMHEEWSHRVMREFHAQGDEELRRGMPVSPLCDRVGFSLCTSQIGFLQFVCVPTWRELARLEALLPSLSAFQAQPPCQAQSPRSLSFEDSCNRGSSSSGTLFSPIVESISIASTGLAGCERNLLEWKRQADSIKLRE